MEPTPTVTGEYLAFGVKRWRPEPAIFYDAEATAETGGAVMRRVFGILTVAVIGMAVGCTVPPPGSNVLVVAYTDVDGIDGYDEAGGDVLIAKLVDSNDDGVVSVGDTVITAQYPKDFAGSQFGSFTDTTHVIDAVDRATSEEILVFEGGLGSDRFVWNDNSGGESYAEAFAVQDTSFVSDNFNSFEEGIGINPDSPSAPDSAISLSRIAATDDPHLDVDILIP